MTMVTREDHGNRFGEAHPRFLVASVRRVRESIRRRSRAAPVVSSNFVSDPSEHLAAVATHTDGQGMKSSRFSRSMASLACAVSLMAMVGLAQPAHAETAAPADPAAAPAAAPAAPAAVEAADPFAACATGSGDKSDLACDQERCEATGKTYVAGIAILDVALWLVAFIVWFWLTRKSILSGAMRALLTGGLAAGVETAVIGLNVGTSETYACCMTSPEFLKYLTLSSITTWPRGAMVGGAPVFVGLFLSIFIFKLIRR